LGKTAIVLSSFRVLKHHGTVNKLLVIAPLRVCSLVWPLELRKWSNFSNMSIGVLHGPRKSAILAEDHDIYVINPEGLQWLEKVIKSKEFSFKKHKWEIVFDESSLFKHSGSKRFKIVKKLLPQFERSVILTGTPAPNGLGNVWSQVYLLDQGERLGKYITQFRNKYFYPTGYMGYDYKLQKGAAQKIYDKISDIILHKGVEELDLPARIDNRIQVTLPKAARDVYESMRESFIAALDEDNVSVAVNAAVASGKLRQICNGAVYGDEGNVINLHDEKIGAVDELVATLDGRPLMVFYEFQHDLAKLLKAFPTAKVLGGGVKTADAEMIVKLWNCNEIPLLLLHPVSAGHGLNLQESDCHDIAWYSIPWDLELYIQANARVHRQGVKNAVTIHHIAAKDTIDERIIKALQTKSSVQDALLDALS